MAPVLPGETLEWGTFQARAVTDPIRSPLIGWWKETYFFYVPFSAMPDREIIREMVLDPTAELDQFSSAPEHYLLEDTAGGGVMFDWVEQCSLAVVNRFFRDASEHGVTNENSEPFSADTASRLRLVHAEGPGWLDSAMQSDEMADVNVDLIDPTGGDDPPFTAQEFEAKWREYRLLQLQGLSGQTYEEYLRTFGISVPQGPADQKLPELVRYQRVWQYPSNTVNPADGTVSTAVSWAVKGRIDKNRLFREPGWLFGAVCVRPKVYFRLQNNSASHFLNTVYHWLPAVLRDDVRLGRRPVNDQMLGNAVEVSWDVKDLFVRGDQFVTDLTSVVSNLVDLPEEETAGINRYYPDLDDIKSFFLSTGTNRYVREDGVVNWHIAGSVFDTEPGAVLNTGAGT